MTCAHCCYSCRPGKGMHMSWENALDALYLAAENDAHLTIGGGEPTLHPRFFDILKRALDDKDFDFVWMATNGSNKKAMIRLANIIQGCDYDSFEREEYCNCDPEDLKNGYDCDCYPSGEIYQEQKLEVALSQDHFHERHKVDKWVVDYWKSKAGIISGYSGFSLHNVSNSVAAQGRAKRTGSGWGDHCVCSDHIIRPDGNIKLCGCTSSPIIGTIKNGIDGGWRKRIRSSEQYQNDKCYKAFRRR